MKIEWKDTTRKRGFSGAKWHTSVSKIGDIEIIVHECGGNPPGVWFVTCHELLITDRKLGEIPLEQAKEAALVVVLDRIKLLCKLAKPLEKAIAAGRK